MLRLSIIFFFFLCVLSPADGQDTRIISSFRQLEQKDGLPENDIKEFCTDSQNGYWFRSSGNVVYYSGHDYVTFGHNNTLFPISSQQVYDISITNDKLYVFGNGGIDEINCITKKSQQIFSDSLKLDIRGGILTRKGLMVVVNSKGDVYQLYLSRLKRIGNMKFFTSCSLRETAEGDILVSNNNREILIFSEQLKLLNHVTLKKNQIIDDRIHPHPNLGTIIVTGPCVFRYNPINKSIDSLEQNTTYKRLFLATEQYNYIVYDFKQILQHDINENVTKKLELLFSANFFINQIAIDKSKTVVLCTNQGVILFKETISAFSALPNPTPNNKDGRTTRRAIVETPDKKIMQFTYRQIDVYDPVTQKNDSLFKTTFAYAALLNGDKVWIGTDGIGLFKLDLNHKKLEPARTIDKVKQGVAMNVTSLSRLNDSIILFGVLFSTSTLKWYNILSDTYGDVEITGLSSRILIDKVTAIVDHDKKTKWICSLKGLMLIENGNVLKKYLGSELFNNSPVNYVYPENQRIISVATDDGLYRYDLVKNKVIQHITVSEGLAGNKCIAILPDHHQSLWIPTYTGLSRYHIPSGQIMNYYIQDGLMDNEYNYAAYLNASNGDIYLGGLNGYVRIKPWPVNENKPSEHKIGLDYVVLNQKNVAQLLPFDSTRKFIMHRSNDRLSFVFSLRNPLSSQYARYYYRVKGLHDEWISLDRQNKIEISYLPTGNYTLQIKSTDLQVQQIANLFELPLLVTEYWYETKTFYLLLSLVLIFSITGLLYSRYSSVKEINRIRTGLANDIHDEIGTMLTKAIVRLELLRKKSSGDTAVIASIENHLRDTVQSFRNVLWALNTDNNKTENFVGRLNIMLQEIFDDTKFEFIITNLSPNIYFKKSINVKRNLLLIIKELANNALKHSNGNLFEVVIRSDGKNWKITIADNGTNIDGSLDSGGLGLSSIKNRVAAMNGEVAISKKDKGFYVVLQL